MIPPTLLLFILKTVFFFFAYTENVHVNTSE